MRRQPERERLIHSTVNTLDEILIMRPKGAGALLVLRELQRFGTVSRRPCAIHSDVLRR
jgi:hypothetical protein